MVGITLKQQLENYIDFMLEQGIVDQHFQHVRVLQNEQNPRFITELIIMFTNDADVAIEEITTNLSEPSVDYGKLITSVYHLKGGSSSIGGRRMVLACRELHRACDDKDKARCVGVFQRVKQEYQLLRENLNHICTIEQSILEYETRGRGKK